MFLISVTFQNKYLLLLLLQKSWPLKISRKHGKEQKKSSTVNNFKRNSYCFLSIYFKLNKNASSRVIDAIMNIQLCVLFCIHGGQFPQYSETLLKYYF